MKVTILRGISGSGKSTYAKENYPEDSIVSADDFFMVDGEYRFDPEDLSLAHASCFSDAITRLETCRDVVIDNTNTSVWEISPYVLLAQAYEAQIEIIRVDCDPAVAAARNTHGVPLSTVFAMAARMETLLPFWPAEKVVGPF